MSGIAIITEACIDVKDRACVDVCPVQCIEHDPVVACAFVSVVERTIAESRLWHRVSSGLIVPPKRAPT